jgi:hypothetical protein
MWRLVFLPFFAVAEIAALFALWTYAVFDPEHAEILMSRVPDLFPDFGWYFGK